MNTVTMSPKIAFVISKLLDYTDEMPMTTEDITGHSMTDKDWDRYSETVGQINKIAERFKQ